MEQTHWNSCDVLSSSYSSHISPYVPDTSTPISRFGLRNKFSAEEIASQCPLQFQQAIQALQQFPKSFIHAWLLMAKSIGLSAQSLHDHYQQGSALGIDQLQAIAILQDLPHDQVLAWYGGDAAYSELFPLSTAG